MGMYTGFIVAIAIKADTPKHILQEIRQFLNYNEKKKTEFSIKIPQIAPDDYEKLFNGVSGYFPDWRFYKEINENDFRVFVKAGSSKTASLAHGRFLKCIAKYLEPTIKSFVYTHYEESEMGSIDVLTDIGVVSHRYHTGVEFADHDISGLLEEMIELSDLDFAIEHMLRIHKEKEDDAKNLYPFSP